MPPLKKKAKKQQELKDLRKVLAFLLHQPRLRLEDVYNEKRRQIRSSFREHDLHETQFPELYLGGRARVRIGGGGIVLGCYRKLSAGDRIYYALKINSPFLF